MIASRTRYVSHGGCGFYTVNASGREILNDQLIKCGGLIGRAQKCVPAGEAGFFEFSCPAKVYLAYVAGGLAENYSKGDEWIDPDMGCFIGYVGQDVEAGEECVVVVCTAGHSNSLPIEVEPAAEKTPKKPSPIRDALEFLQSVSSSNRPPSGPESIPAPNLIPVSEETPAEPPVAIVEIQNTFPLSKIRIRFGVEDSRQVLGGQVVAYEVESGEPTYGPEKFSPGLMDFDLSAYEPGSKIGFQYQVLGTDERESEVAEVIFEVPAGSDVPVAEIEILHDDPESTAIRFTTNPPAVSANLTIESNGETLTEMPVTDSATDKEIRFDFKGQRGQEVLISYQASNEKGIGPVEQVAHMVP